MFSVFGEYERSRLMLGGMSNHGGVADLIGRRGLNVKGIEKFVGKRLKIYQIGASHSQQS